MWGWHTFLLFVMPDSSSFTVWGVAGRFLSSSKVRDCATVLFHFLYFLSIRNQPCLLRCLVINSKTLQLEYAKLVTRFPYKPSQSKPGQGRLSGSPSATNTDSQGAQFCDDDDSHFWVCLVGYSPDLPLTLALLFSTAAPLDSSPLRLLHPRQAYNTSITQTPNTQAPSTSFTV